MSIILNLSVPDTPPDLNNKSSDEPSNWIAHLSSFVLLKLFARTKFAPDAAAGPAILIPEFPPPWWKLQKVEAPWLTLIAPSEVYSLLVLL